ncbi:MAG: hypothetical protein WCK73_11430 [Deltaproteobacteria bacterium]
MSNVDVREEIVVVEVLTSPVAPPPPDPSGPVRARLLRMADGYRRAGSPNQAIEMYFELAERDGETPEGQKARDGLMALCEEYERDGKLRQARALYERLL